MLYREEGSELSFLFLIEYSYRAPQGSLTLTLAWEVGGDGPAIYSNTLSCVLNGGQQSFKCVFAQDSTNVIPCRHNCLLECLPLGF